MWKINLSKQTDRFMRNKKIKDNEILSFINKFINYSKGSDENINVKRMKGKCRSRSISFVLCPCHYNPILKGFHKSFPAWKHSLVSYELVSFDETLSP